MKQVLFSDFRIEAIASSARKEEISDEIYFSKAYSDYISNSRLKLINPEQNGSAIDYFESKYQSSSQSLQIGSAVHECFLQSDDFQLVEGYQKPSAKLGNVVEKIIDLRKQGWPISVAINRASELCDYYSGQLTKNRIKTIISKGLFYYLKSKELNEGDVCLSDSDTKVVKECLNSLTNDQNIVNLVKPTDWAGDPIKSFNEDAMFLNLWVKYKGRKTKLKLKMKADNWSIDEYSKVLTLNDLKTTGKPLAMFMRKEGSFDHFHYARQFAMYSMILKYFAAKEFDFTKDWKFNANVMVVETIPPYRAKSYVVNPSQIKQGRIELLQLLKRVAYYQMFGYKNEVEFL